MAARLMSIAPSLVAALATFGIIFAQALGASAARADTPTEDAAARDRQRAAASFDDGVARFGRAEFEAAARAFLEADRLAPSERAIVNAITAARRAGDHLLVAQAAERAIARGDALVPAREALAEATTRLARLELTCDTAPCVLSIDGAVAGASVEYTLPGTHHVEAVGSEGARADERLSCIAGATYRVALHPTKAGPVAPTSPPPVPVLTPTAPIADSPGVPRAVFFVGVGATALLVGLTTWSGLDALAAKRALPSEPEQAQNDAVLGRARRTDVLLGGAALAGAGTAVLGLWFVKWSGSVAAGVAPVAGGSVLVAHGVF